jgi:ABC-type uncharacterized transport system auxiliary subunit
MNVRSISTVSGRLKPMKAEIADILNFRVCSATFAVAMMVLLSACGASRPVKYYVLDIQPLAPSSGPQFPVSLIVGRIVTNQLYRADRLVYGSGPVQLGTYEYERWAESPADMIQDALIMSLRSTGQYRSVSRVASSVRGDYIVRGRLFSLYEADDKSTMAGRFSLQLELFDPKSGMTLWNDSYSHDQPIEGKKVPDVVAALDRNVRAGLQQLTANLGQYFASHPPQEQPHTP